MVAGYYRGLATTPLAEAVIPYVLVMPDQVDPTDFLPATRSMLLKKAVWRQLGGFDETLNHNEDYAFARRLQANKYQIAFAQNAIVLWHPRTTLKSFIVMIYRFAIGDAESGCYRPKVGLVFLRYLLVKVGVMLLALTSGAALAGWVLLGVFLLYSCWAVLKNYRYAQNGWYWLPVLQYCADGAVMVGTAIGLSRALIRPRR